MSDTLQVLALADIHGNRWALEAVLRDARRHRPDLIVNLGDSLYGPLDPAGTATILQDLDAVNIRCNEDRMVLDAHTGDTSSPTLSFVLDSLGPADRTWLARHVPLARCLDVLLCCHGTPDRDEDFLCEKVTGTGALPRSMTGVMARLPPDGMEMTLCGHSHTPRTLSIPDGRLVVKPGSVGLPAYIDDHLLRHAMETGSPHARYAFLTRRSRRWRIDQVAVPYAWERAARAAMDHGRPDWARWLRSGRASP